MRLLAVASSVGQWLLCLGPKLFDVECGHYAVTWVHGMKTSCQQAAWLDLWTCVFSIEWQWTRSSWHIASHEILDVHLNVKHVVFFQGAAGGGGGQQDPVSAMLAAAQGGAPGGGAPPGQQAQTIGLEHFVRFWSWDNLRLQGWRKVRRKIGTEDSGYRFLNHQNRIEGCTVDTGRARSSSKASCGETLRNAKLAKADNTTIVTYSPSQLNEKGHPFDNDAGNWWWLQSRTCHRDFASADERYIFLKAMSESISKWYPLLACSVLFFCTSVPSVLSCKDPTPHPLHSGLLHLNLQQVSAYI